jgi:hypothetical protein
LAEYLEMDGHTWPKDTAFDFAVQHQASLAFVRDFGNLINDKAHLGPGLEREEILS